MKKLLLAVVAVVVSTVGMRAQDLAGTWQGTLQAAQPQRVVLKISAADGGGLKATMYSIDRIAQPLAVSALALQGGSLKFEVPGVGGSYEGNLNAEANALTGSFTQGGMPMSLNLTHVAEAAAWAIPAPPAALAPMAAAHQPVFEVATIKRANPGAQGKAFTVRGHQVMTVNTTLVDLITWGYGLHANQVIGGEAWVRSDHYDVTGEPDAEGVPNQSQLRYMLQRLAADRFQVTFHREKRELSVYAIVVGNQGPKLTKSQSDPSGLPSLLLRGLGSMPARNATMADLAGIMQAAILDRPVVDQTGLTDHYDFTLNWTPDETQFAGMGIQVPAQAANPDPSAAPGLFTAIQEQLGLKFESTKATVDVIVIDRAERPSEN